MVSPNFVSLKIFERYFERNIVLSPPVFSNHPDVIVIIPVLNDRDIFATIDSLRLCSTDEGEVGVMIVVNHSENTLQSVKHANRLLAEELRRYIGDCCSQDLRICFQVIEAFDLPGKYAGVGLARKIVMDAAALYFYREGKGSCPILSLDADTLVEKNYFDECIRFFRTFPVAGVSIAYSHRMEDCTEESREAMIKYELYLRYYQLALRYSGHPHAFHCIGSAFAVRAADYVAQGGMNKRQAGEDFYFLQKLIVTGRYAVLNSTRVYPSSRFSDRTPFGTGQSVRQIVEQKGVFLVYNFRAFQDLKLFFEGLSGLYKANDVAVSTYFAKQVTGIRNFLEETDGKAVVAEVNANCASVHQFVRRFFDYFNAFRVLKYLNYVHETVYAKMDIELAIDQLFTELGYSVAENNEKNLCFLREKEKAEDGI